MLCLRSCSCLWGTLRALLALWGLKIEMSSEERKEVWALRNVSELDVKVFVPSLHFIYRHFLCLPLSFNTGLLGDAGTFCDPVPEAAFCEVSINRENPAGYCTLSITYPGKPLPTLLPRQGPPHRIRITLGRLHYSDECTYVFTVQMGLLAFLGKNVCMRVCLLLCSSALKIRLAVEPGCWPKFAQHSTEQQHCLQLVEQIEDVLNSFTGGIMERCKSTTPPTNNARSEEKKRGTKRMRGVMYRRYKHSPDWLIIGV